MKLSVCMAVYNGSCFVGDQLVSILSQLNADDEVIVSDNNSSDSTLDVIRSFNDPRIKIVHENIPGVIYNFQNALRHATGDIVFLADQDDVWLPDKVSVVLEALRDADLVVHDARVVDAELNLLSDSLFKVVKSSPGFFKNLFRNSYVGCCMAFRRDVLDQALPIPKGIGMHDWWIGLVAEVQFRVMFIDQPLLNYRRHVASVSATADVSNATISTKLCWRVCLVWHLFKRCV
ncbi:glycosyltransferase family 2 protein [Neptuniibacter sp. CAU 1671]|uniref:glycosyltransferase family 2 protein n=1 Tax=Neptuniibacter sp. CAU 1671 TaxID=3032593 RepID=UPI0023DA9732|nr:glycosyltransferase family 2 protein [Neptuniibacter sp. CAU 1671]MDF2181402.1 glycosyltransferase family 2 protein [Neptuniibacter sp. CAU 1671]